MYLGTIIGSVVATVKNETLVGRKLLLVRRAHDGETVVAVDSVGAGVGERVYVCRGREASFAFRPDTVPSDATIVGIID
jgi:ethanolamine utilization protein EutN